MGGLGALSTECDTSIGWNGITGSGGGILEAWIDNGVVLFFVISIYCSLGWASSLGVADLFERTIFVSLLLGDFTAIVCDSCAVIEFGTGSTRNDGSGLGGGEEGGDGKDLHILNKF